MEIVRESNSGTLQSSDVMVIVKPAPDKGRVIIIESTASSRYKNQIEELVNSVLDEMGIENIDITLKDQGALPFALKARIKTAIKRASNQGGENE